MENIVLPQELFPDNINFYLTCKNHAKHIGQFHQKYFQQKVVLVTTKEEIVKHITKFVQVTHIKVIGNFTIPFSELPKTLEYLSLESYNQPLPSIPSLKKLFLGDLYTYPLPIFPSLEQLWLSDGYNYPLPDMPFLKTLWLGDRYNQPLPNMPSLEFLYLGYDFYHESINRISDRVKVDTTRMEALF